MNKEQNDTEDPETSPVMDVEVCESDETFVQSLNEFIEKEKKYLQCPEEGTDELRYIVYRSAFNKVSESAEKIRVEWVKCFTQNSYGSSNSDIMNR